METAAAELQSVGRDLACGRVASADLAERAARLNRHFRAVRESEDTPAPVRTLIERLVRDYDVAPDAPPRLDALRHFLERECGLDARSESDCYVRDASEFEARAAAMALQTVWAPTRTRERALPGPRRPSGACAARPDGGGDETFAYTLTVIQHPDHDSNGPAVILLDFANPPAAPMDLGSTMLAGRSTSESLFVVPWLSAIDGLEMAMAFSRNVHGVERAARRLRTVLASLEAHSVLELHRFSEGYETPYMTWHWSVESRPGAFRMTDRPRPQARVALGETLSIPRPTMLNLTCALLGHALMTVLGVDRLVDARWQAPSRQRLLRIA